MADQEPFQDPYRDPAWGGLRNKVGARSAPELRQAEADLVEARTQQLRERPISPTFDLSHLCAIHGHLFQDVYDWAGEPRRVNLSKPDDTVGFFPHQRFGIGVPAVFDAIRDRNFRPGMDRKAFVDALTATYDELNHLHPFREGNGRTQRIFLSQLAEHAGYRLKWQQVTRLSRNDEVSRAAGHGDLEPMRQMLDEITTQTPTPNRDAEPSTTTIARGADSPHNEQQSNPTSRPASMRPHLSERQERGFSRD